MKVYTIESGEVSEGAIVEKLALKGAGIEIPVLKGRKSYHEKVLWFCAGGQHVRR